VLIVTSSSRRSSAAAATGNELLPAPTLPDESRRSFQGDDGYRSVKVKLIGASPLLMHSSRLVNSLDPLTKELRKISKKRGRTDADTEYMARLEFVGGLWLDAGAPCIPGEAIETAFVQAARKSKRGSQARAGILAPDNWSLRYDGPRSAQELWDDERFRFIVPVRVGTSRLMRTRAVFRNWEAEGVLNYLDDQFDEADVIEILQTAGRIIGVGDWRPRFGRFEVEG
jgi:hypothetical protein